MKQKIRALSVLAIGVLMLVAPRAAMATGTTACTPILNTATMDYTVGGVSQPQKTATATFTVGDKVIVTAVRQDAAPVSVAPGASGSVLTFLVHNGGNYVHDYGLAGVAMVNGTVNPFGLPADNFNAAGFNVYVESGTTPGYQAAEDTKTYIDEMAADATQTVYLVSTTIPITQIDTDVAVYSLTASTLAGGVANTQGAVTAQGAANACGNTAPTVFADAAGTDDVVRDGKYSSRDAFKVSGVVLTVAKTSTVISDPVNGTTSPKAIPGAIVEYATRSTLTSGSGSVAGLLITDTIPANLTAQINVYGGTGEVQLNTKSGGTSASTNLDSTNLLVTGWGITPGSLIKVNCGVPLTAIGDYCEMKFQVLIQ